MRGSLEKGAATAARHERHSRDGHQVPAVPMGVLWGENAALHLPKEKNIKENMAFKPT